MRALRLLRSALLGLALALGASLLAAPSRAADVPAPPASVDDIGPLPCMPGVIRPKSAATPIPVVRPSSLLEEQEREVAATRARADEFQRATDDAVRNAWAREREAVHAKFAMKAKPLEAQERAQRAAAIEEFKAFLSRRGDSSAAGEAMYRLAELQFEEASDAYVVAHQAWEALARNAAPDAPVPPPEPRPDFKEAVASYRQLVTRYGGYGRKDGALYMIAYCLGEMGDAKGARDSFEELATTVPKSEYAPEAWLRVGEYHFDRNELWPAIDAYGHAAGAPGSPFYDKALYKLAWSWYRLADANHPAAWEESARTFGKLLDAAPSSTLRAEALQYLALIYADHGGLAEVRSATEGRSWAKEVFPSLAQVWFEEGAWKDAAEAFRLALEAAPDADAAPVWLHRRALSLARTGRAADAAAAREELHRRYGTGSAWAAARASHPAVVASAASLAEAGLLQAAVFAHQHAQETAAEADYFHAAQLYGEYLKAYPGRPAAYDISFYRGECFYYSQHFAEAADAYGDVLQFTRDDRWHAEAAFSRVKAREKLLAVQPSTAEPAPGAATVALDPGARAFATAAEDFTCVAPTDWRVPEALFRAAEVYYGARRLAAARSRATAVVDAAPKEDLAAWSAALIVDAWRLEGNWTEVEAAAKKYAALEPGRNPAVRESTRENLARVAVEAGYRVAEELEAKGRREEAAAKFLALAEANPKADIAPLALFAGADLLEKLGQGARAADTFQRVAKSWPASAYAPLAMFRHARAEERILHLSQAADAWAEFAKKHPQSKDAVAAEWNIPIVLEAAGRFPDAAAAWERYADRHAKDADAAAARLRSAECWTRAGKSDRSLRAWRALVSATALDGPRNVLALAGLSRAERAARLPSDAEARRALEAQSLLLARGESTPESARAAAAAGLAKADDLWKSFEGVQVALPEAKLRSALRVKHDLLVQLEDTWLSVASAGDPDAATEALDRIGEAYASYARSVLDAPVPAGSQRSRDDWREKAIQTAEPLQEKAAAAFRHNLDLAKKAGIATPWTRRSELGLAALEPDAQAPREDALPLPPPDVWVLPVMLTPPGVRVADASGATGAPSENAAALGREVGAWNGALAEGNRAALVEGEKRLAALVTKIAAEPGGELKAIAWADLGIARETLDDHAGANVAFEAALGADHDLAAAAAGEVLSLAKKGDPATAISAANAWLERHPQDAAVRTNLAGAHALHGDTALALDTAIDALGFDANLGPARRAAIEYALAAKRPELALFAAQQASQMGSDARAEEELGLTLRRSGDERIYGRAAGRETLVAALEKFPDDARLGWAAGVALFQDGSTKRALAVLEKAAPRSIDPSAWIALAAARRANGDAAPAAQAADAALALRPDDAAALRNRGLAAADAGDFAAAEAAFRRYLAVTEGRRATGDPVEGWLADAVGKRKQREATP